MTGDHAMILRRALSCAVTISALASTISCGRPEPEPATRRSAANVRLSAPATVSSRSSDQRHVPYLVDDCWSAHLRPTSLVYACGDAGVPMSRIEWLRWTRHRAVGVAGTVGVKNGCCKAHVLHDVQLVAFSPRPYRNGRAAFGCMRVHPGLTRNQPRDVLWLSSSWLGRVDDRREQYQRCPGYDG
jgi:hypothetical protein